MESSIKINTTDMLNTEKLEEKWYIQSLFAIEVIAEIIYLSNYFVMN